MPIRDTQINIDATLIDLSIGHPSDSLLPLKDVQAFADIHLANADRSLLQYGPKQGNKSFRDALADFLSYETKAHVDSDSLLATTGATQALNLICTLFAKSGDMVWVEDPTYFLSHKIFSSHHLLLDTVATDDEGLIVDDLEQKLKESKPAFLYLIPTFQNPSGRTLSKARRERLLEISKEHDLLVVADEVYTHLHYEDQQIQPLGQFVHLGKLISVNSFSKILGPGLRLGWIQAASEQLEPFLSSPVLFSGGGLNPFTSAIIGEALAAGFQSQHLANLRAVYRERMRVMGSVLEDLMPPNTQFTTPGGGYFYWVNLPGVNTLALLEHAAEKGVRFQPGTNFSAQGNFTDFVRLSFSFYESDVIVEGVKRLADTLNTLCA